MKKSNNPILRLASKFAPREKRDFFGFRRIVINKAFAVQWTDRQFFWTNKFWGYLLAFFRYDVWEPYEPNDENGLNKIVYNSRFDEEYVLVSYWDSLNGYEIKNDDSWMVTNSIWRKIKK